MTAVLSSIYSAAFVGWDDIELDPVFDEKRKLTLPVASAKLNTFVTTLPACTVNGTVQRED